MIRDPFFRKIIDQLNEKLDPPLFEDCAVDLIQPDFPGIVLIEGGADEGMDGAIADFKGHAFPLITTTAGDVIGNLTRNLNSYLSKGGKRRRAVLATSQKLTQRRRKNLELRAEELGFTLIQIFDQNSIARRIYHRPKWCLELLGLSGDAPALSIIPKSKRPLIENELIGRDENLRWLNETKGDKLIYGQPGSGKTFLLYNFAQQENGLFVVSEDLTLIASNLREEKPKILIVDDANINIELLTALIQFRNQSNIPFDIVTTCWPSYKSQVSDILGLPNSQIADLGLLSRDTIVEIINQAGVVGPVNLVRDLVDQAQGRPGLVVTLVSLCLKGDAQKVVLGDVLCQNILNSFQPLIGENVSVILASFAIGGDGGMSLAVVADFLRLSIVEVHNTVTTLAAGGVIKEINNELLKVTPAQLRFALVRDIFFKGATSLDPQNLLDKGISFDKTIITLIAAKARGARIPFDKLLSLVKKTQSLEVWEVFAWSGKDEAKISIATNPDKVISLAYPSLKHIPEEIIPMLLKTAIDDSRELHSTPSQPLRIIQDWIKSSKPGTGSVFKRRKILLDSISIWVKRNGNEEVAQRALVFVFCLEFESNYSDPGDGNTFTLNHGIVTAYELNEIMTLWPLAYDILKEFKNRNWSHIFKLLQNVISPFTINIRVPGDFTKAINKYEKEIIRNLAGLSKNHPGVIQKLYQKAQRIKLKLNLKLDEDYEALFPIRETENWREDQKRRIVAIKALVQRLKNKKSDFIAKKLKEYESEALLVGGHRWPRLTPLFCELMSSKINIKTPFVLALVDMECPADLVEPFLKKAVESEETGWQDLVYKYIDDKNIKVVAISIVLRLQSPPEILLNKSLSSLNDLSYCVETLCLRNEIPDKTLSKLLIHPDREVSSKTAKNMWMADPEGIIPKKFQKEWGKAIINLSERDDHCLQEIFSTNPNLAYTWLLNHITKRPDSYYSSRKIYKTAVKHITKEKKLSLLKILPEDFYQRKIVKYLIGNDLPLFNDFLKIKKQKHLHLSSLKINIDKEINFTNWVSLAKIALEGGYTAEEIASACRLHSYTWSGRISKMWEDWVLFFNTLLKDDNKQIKKIASIGKKSAQFELNEAKKQEKHESIYGI